LTLIETGNPRSIVRKVQDYLSKRNNYMESMKRKGGCGFGKGLPPINPFKGY